MVQRYIDDCRAQGLSRTKIKNGLAKDICGIEIDEKQYLKCIDNLNNLVKANGIKAVEWNIFNEDYFFMKVVEVLDESTMAAWAEEKTAVGITERFVVHIDSDGVG